MSHLTISLLGPVQVNLDGQVVSGFAYNKARALLAYLAVEADRSHHRDTIVGLLWPDSPDAAARTNLRQVLTNLRDAIGADFLITTRDSLQFNPASDYELDVTHFTSLLGECARHRHRHIARCPACAARLEEAIQLYRGDFLAQLPSVDSAPFEEWLVLKREALHQRAVEALSQLAQYHERWGHAARAHELLTRLIELEPWNEAAQARLIRLLYRIGQRSAALAQYEVCRRILADQFNVEPIAATQQLIEQIRAGKPIEDAAPTRSVNVPIAVTPLIGRESELSELTDLLADPACRLITLVGPGGIGKTRLAIAASTATAPMFDDGATFVNLAGLNSADLLAATLLSALDQPLEQAVTSAQQLVNYLRHRERLLLLDNFEHLLDGVDLIIQLLQQTRVTLLITSRERLALQAEQVFELEGLSPPAAEQLFVERAQRVQRKFQLAPDNSAAIARICRLVEGLPLAIELAASTVGGRSCATIADEIAGNLAALSTRHRDVPERHRSLWAAFEQSWQLLTRDEQIVFSRLSVFHGGFVQEAAVAVAAATPALLTALIDKSLVRRDSGGRYAMHELLRQYGHAQLIRAGELEHVQAQQLAWYMQLAAEAEVQLMGKEQAGWLRQLEAENDNLRAVLQWALDRNLIDRAARLTSALWRFWWTRGYLSEGRQWFRQVYAHSDTLPVDVSAKLFNQAAVLAAQQGDFDEARRLFEQNLALNRQQNNLSGVANALNNLGALSIEQAHYDQARVYLEESLPLRRQLGNQTHIAATLNNLGTVAHCQSDLPRAQQHFAESLKLYRELGDTRSIAGVLNNLGGVALQRDDPLQAQAFYRESLQLRHAVGDKAGVAECLEGLAAVAARQIQPHRSAQLYGAASALRETIGAPLPPTNAATNDQFLREVQAQLGDTAFAAAWQTGRAGTLADLLQAELQLTDGSA